MDSDPAQNLKYTEPDSGRSCSVFRWFRGSVVLLDYVIQCPTLAQVNINLSASASGETDKITLVPV
jgi:hypothetical protein